MRELLYDRAAAVAYARRWALGRNPAYHDFQHLGGDCTNFASQCLFAGAGIMNFTPDTGWYYRSLNDRAPAWTGVTFLARFLLNNGGVGPQARLAALSALLPGDLIQLGTGEGRYYHTLVVTRTHPEILVCAHTYDALDRPLAEYSFSVLRGLHLYRVLAW